MHAFDYLHLYFHPSSRTSQHNFPLYLKIKETPKILSRDLYAEYPDFSISVEKEKSLLSSCQGVIFQHPLYWYSCPSLMKEWMDRVLELGWAYGPGGDALRGKKWIHLISTGGPEQAYQRSGYNEFELLELLRPYERTARLCQMTPLRPLVAFATPTSPPLIHTVYSELMRLLEDPLSAPVWNSTDLNRKDPPVPIPRAT